jgi:hypothetical protein
MIKKIISYINNVIQKSIEESDLIRVREDPYSIIANDDCSDVVKLQAIHIEPNVIQYIDGPNLNMQMTAVSINPYTIQYIKDPHPDVQLAAVERVPKLIFSINNPTPEAWEQSRKFGLLSS